jgi:hypothetical protein
MSNFVGCNFRDIYEVRLPRGRQSKVDNLDSGICPPLTSTLSSTVVGTQSKDGLKRIPFV